MNYLTALDIAEPYTAPQTERLALSQARWTAIVLAGQRPGLDPLACAFGQTYKALIKIDGQPMLARVLRCLLQSPSVGRIVVLAQEPEALLQDDLAWAASHNRIVPLVSSGGIAKSIADVAGTAEAPWPVFVTTADHALLTPEMVESFLGRTGDADLSVAAVERSVVQSRYAACERTWLKFSDGAFTGANMFALANGRTAAALKLWSSAEQDRKQAFRLFLHFGSGLALRAMTRTIGFGPAIAAAGRKLGVSARLVDLDIADAAIDVDKPSDHCLAEAILRKRRSDELIAVNAPRKPGKVASCRGWHSLQWR